MIIPPTAEIAHVGSRYAVQSHSRSLMLIPAKFARMRLATNLHPISRHFAVIAQINQIIAFDKAVPLVKLPHLFSLISLHIVVRHILPETILQTTVADCRRQHAVLPSTNLT